MGAYDDLLPDPVLEEYNRTHQWSQGGHVVPRKDPMTTGQEPIAPDSKIGGKKVVGYDRSDPNMLKLKLEDGSTVPIPVEMPNPPVNGEYDDLIMQADQSHKGEYDDIVHAASVARTAQSRASDAKVYWDATKGAFVDLTGQIKEGWGEKNMWELMKTESLPAHLQQGMERQNLGQRQEIDPLTGSLTQRQARPEELTDEERHAEFESLKQDMAEKDRPKAGMLDTLKGLGVTLHDKPGLLIGSLGKTLVADPELLLPWLWDVIPEATAAKVAQAAKAMGASTNIAKAAQYGGRVAGRMATGAGVNVAVEGAGQFAAGQPDVGALGAAGVEGAVASAPGRLASKERPVLHPHDPLREHEVVPNSPDPQLSLDLEPAAVEKVAKVPDERLSPFDQTREKLAAATKEDPVTPEMIAEVGREPIKNPKESRERLLRAIKQAAIGGAIGAGVGEIVGTQGEKETAVESGIFLGAGLPLLKARKFTGPNVFNIVQARNGQVRVVARAVYQFQHQLEKLLPVKAEREQLAEMIDRGVVPAEGTPMHEAYQHLKQFFADMGQLAKENGVIDDLRENYISHIVEEDPQAGKTLIQKFLGAIRGEKEGTGVSGKSFGKGRKYDTFEELNAAIKDSGLRLKTKDASEIAGIYANAVYKSVADRRLLEALRQVKLADGTGVLEPVKDAPRTYVRSIAPQLAGVSIHPDIAPDLGFVFTHRNPNWLRTKLEGLTSSIKRIAVSTSLFHAKTLIEGAAAAQTTRWNPREALRMYREGGNNDIIDHLIKHGLIIGTPEDVAGREVQNGMGKMADALNARFPIAGKVPKAIAAVDRGVEKFTFGFLQTGMKLNVAMSEFEKMVARGVDRDRAAKIASSYANDVFGSLDYYSIARDTDSYIMRAIGGATLTANGRKLLQLALFAPDWTMATFRTAAKAMPGGTADPVLAQIHRRYMLKAGLYYLYFANMVNYAQTGHSIFENKDVTRVELGDGRTMQFSKHETEPLDWLKHPVDTMGNKFAFLPGSLWKTARAHTVAKMHGKPAPTPVEDLAAVAETTAPISTQQFIQNGMHVDAISSLVGFPIYGKKQSEDKPRARKADNRSSEDSGSQTR